MTTEQRKNIKAAQLAALLNRLKDGKPLTSAQLAFIEKAFPELDNPKPSQIDDDGGAPEDNGAGDVVSSANQLAKHLGVSRQLIAHHRNRVGAPTEFSIAAWRAYLRVWGKQPTLSKLHGTEPDPVTENSYDGAFAALFYQLSEALPMVMRLALARADAKMSSHKADMLTFCVWLQCAGIYQALAKQHDAFGPFDPITEDGRPEYPEVIQKLAARVANTIPPDPPATQKAQQPSTDSHEPQVGPSVI